MCLLNKDGWLISKLGSASVLAILVFATGLYFFPPGYPQPGHVLLLALAIPYLLSLRSVPLDLPEKLLISFLVYGMGVNGVYYIIEGDSGFLKASVFWIYNVLIFLSLRFLFLRNPSVSKALPYAFAAMALVLYAMAFFWESESFRSNGRFVGGFNDPNQSGYWLLCVFVGSMLIATKPRWLTAPKALLLFVAVAVLVVLTGSRSAILGFSVLLLANIGWLLAGLGQGAESRLKLRTFFLFIAILVVAASLVGWYLYVEQAEFRRAVDLLMRRLLQEDYFKQLDIRGYTHIWNFPQYLLFGAGHADVGRFSRWNVEIHSSIVAPLFYYGIIGFGLLFSFFYLLVKDRLRGWEFVAFSAPFVFGLSTYGLRNPIFWVMLAVVYTHPLRPVARAKLDEQRDAVGSPSAGNQSSGQTDDGSRK